MGLPIGLSISEPLSDLYVRVLETCVRAVVPPQSILVWMRRADDVFVVCDDVVRRSVACSLSRVRLYDAASLPSVEAQEGGVWVSVRCVRMVAWVPVCRGDTGGHQRCVEPLSPVVFLEEEGTGDGACPFLDLLFRIGSDRRLVWTVFRKPSDQPIRTHGASWAPRDYVFAPLRAHARRAVVAIPPHAPAAALDDEWATQRTASSLSCVGVDPRSVYHAQAAAVAAGEHRDACRAAPQLFLCFRDDEQGCAAVATVRAIATGQRAAHVTQARMFLASATR